jgi:hypothetical protein
VEEREVAVERQAAHMQMVQQQVQAQMPDLRKLSDIMSAREQEDREQRDAKVLRLLRTKDEGIATLKGQVEGLERVLEQTRGKLAAAEKALDDKHKEAERAWRDHQDALASSQVPITLLLPLRSARRRALPRCTPGPASRRRRCTPGLACCAPSLGPRRRRGSRAAVAAVGRGLIE